jgi:arginase family enzyme
MWENDHFFFLVSVHHAYKRTAHTDTREHTFNLHQHALPLTSVVERKRAFIYFGLRRKKEEEEEERKKNSFSGLWCGR